MRINKRFIKCGVLGILFLMLTGTGLAAAVQITSKTTTNFAAIAKQCSNSVDSDGFGHAEIGTVHIQDEVAKLSTPCILNIREGANLQFTNVRVDSDKLFITTQPDATKPVHITINKSTFKSVSGGFQFQIKSSKSSITIQNSTLNFPLSLGISVGSGDDDTTAALRVTGSSFISSSFSSEGILLVTTGQATFKDNQFKLGNPDDSPLLVAAQCQEKNNGSAIVHCR